MSRHSHKYISMEVLHMSDQVFNTDEFIKDVKSIITSDKYYFYIPLYQRGYRWSTEEAKKLIDDVYDNYKRNHERDKKNKYSLQALVLKKVNENFSLDNKTYTKYNVIDGQQRLTTLAIIFCARNDLEKACGSKQFENDRISIGYERGNGSLNIRTFCEEIYTLIKDGNGAFDPTTITKTLNNRRTLTIDEQFVMSVYLYCYGFFLEKINTDDYFDFLDDEHNSGSINRLIALRSMFANYTSVIWYETTHEDEEEFFKNLNAKKIDLTRSELVKALFMNPEHYLGGESSALEEETIKIRQINIGAHWDEIEKQLHSESFWHFFPHYDEWHERTRFDAIIDFFVYKEEKEREKKLHKDTAAARIQKRFINNRRHSFDMLWEWITKELEEVESSERPENKKPSTRADIMNKWWNKICDIYDWYYMIYNTPQLGENTSSSGANGGNIPSFAVYHRVALLQLLANEHFSHADNKGSELKYFNQLDLGIEIINALEDCAKSEIKGTLNNIILERIDKSWDTKPISVFSTSFDEGERLGIDKKSCDNLDKKLRAMVYDSDNFLIPIFLVIDSLSVLEKTGGALSRFDFLDYDSKNIWIREHIFARGTNFDVALEGEEREVFLQNLPGCGWEEYLEFKYKGLLDSDDDNNMYMEKLKDVKQFYLKCIRDALDDQSDGRDAAISSVLKSCDDHDYPADMGMVVENENLPPASHAAAVKFLKDDSMGNMSILTNKDNSRVNNGSYKEKMKKVSNLIDEGGFIPMNAVNVFSGKYCDSNFDHRDYWYPCHRMEYLIHLISHIHTYLGLNNPYDNLLGR